MAIPAKLPILQMEDYHTEYIGQAADGTLFMAFETFVFSPPFAELTPQQQQDWPAYRREYAVLHRFDAHGTYQRTDAWYGGTTATCDPAQLHAQLLALLAPLGQVSYQDIQVAPFRTQIDGFTFGLIPNPAAQTVSLEPNGLLFESPWDGEYYT
jgi:hypothetical protein